MAANGELVLALTGELILAPFISGPFPGALAFANNVMVRFSSSEIFTVYNGQWIGSYDGTSILVHDTIQLYHCSPFKQVISLSDNIREQYEMHDEIVLSDHSEYDEDDIPF